VLTFRADAESRKKFRRFVHWFDADCIGKSEEFIREHHRAAAGRLRGGTQETWHQDLDRRIGNCARQECPVERSSRSRSGRRSGCRLAVNCRRRDSAFGRHGGS
jgi:hypothetical protein